jgi:hypothetical protein
MKNERVKKGDIRINEETKEVEICAGYLDCWDGRSPRWEDYESHFLHTRMGMDLGSNRVHTLQHFIDVLDKDKSAGKESKLMRVEIKDIAEEINGDVLLLIRCCPPRRKQTPISNGREELDQNNKLFKEYAKEYRQGMKEFRERTQTLHLGEAKLYQGSGK